MTQPPAVPPPDVASRGYAHAAASSTRWTTAQGIVNKVATAIGMLIVVRAMDPVEYGMAWLVIAASSFVMVLPIYVMGDVLISHQHHLASVSRAAATLTSWSALVCVLLAVGTAPFIAWHYEQYPFTPVAVLLALSALRPLADAVSVHALTELRMSLRYREISMITAVSHLGSTVLTVVWAVVWPSAAAIVVPQLLAAVAKAIGFMAAAARRPGRVRSSVHRIRQRRPDLAARIRRRVAREFGMASLAQYSHTLVVSLPLLITSLFVSEDDVGQFSFAYSLALQAVSIFSYQLAVVLQPIFGMLKTDPQRQLRGFMRMFRLMAAVTVPVALLQAALAEPLIIQVFGEKWRPSIPIFIAFCFCSAQFLLAPLLALLKAQGRFGTTLAWQTVHALVLVIAFPLAARAFGGVGVAWADSAVWTVSVLIAVALGVRRSGVGLGTIVIDYAKPWITAGPIALAAWLAWRAIPGSPLVAAIIGLGVIGPIGLLLSILAIRITQPGVAVELVPFMKRALPRLPLVGRPLAAWFCSVAAPTEADP